MSEASVEEFHKFVDQCRRAVSHQVAGHTEPFQKMWSELTTSSSWERPGHTPSGGTT